MMLPTLLLPPALRAKRTCPRCGLRYDRQDAACPHCIGLTDREVETLKGRARAERESGAHLGLAFLLMAVIALALMLVVVYR
ncbi:MAG: hypothetical protein GWN84_08850 [Gammaproteobacteria bacterium]|nr:hypothetical protein [Gammaproteobacteria bacterium]NIR83847.1 hypothetical protein [Gammaproteobacteria bacterium]NIU04147.1 hypothetical protein [Gammaproteobacteria bacterium]NIX85421.1 hypothetical protein [Gammaproteobacteria bacterium]